MFGIRTFKCTGKRLAVKTVGCEYCTGLLTTNRPAGIAMGVDGHHITPSIVFKNDGTMLDTVLLGDTQAKGVILDDIKDVILKPPDS